MAFVEYNPNPSNKRVGDCAIRAVSKAIGKGWVDTYISLCSEGLIFRDMPNANYVWGMYLKKNGFEEKSFAEDYQENGAGLMFSKGELLDAIEELENAPATYQNAEKLSTFYLLYDHLYVRKEPVNYVESTKEVTIDRYGDSEFLQAIEGQKAEDGWLVMNELMETIQLLHPKLYRATLDKLRKE